ncbi:unnamed protein product [Porites lobata]|uniref:Uncharacterized protein n=1 Tax=Porites lobata TaxID=104759 RepID=A0ABN8RR54_9CNID|nr:unnamed protein product [Porites lobata]
MATFVPYLIALYSLSSVHAQLQMAIDRVDQASAVEDDLLLPRNTAECPVDGNNNLSPSCSKYNAQLLGGCFCKCGRPAGEKYTFFEPTNSCLKVSLARQRSECNLLFIGEKAESALTFIPSTGVTPKTINLPINNSCSFHFGETLYAYYIGCDGAWREIPPNSVNESLEVTPGWNKNQLQFKTRDTASSFLRKNPGRIFRVAVQCRQQRENRDVVANSTCVMFKVEGRIQCPIPQKTPLNQSATLPPPTVEIFSTTDLPPGPTTAQAENITTGTPAVVTNTSSPIPKQNSSNQSVTSGPETVKITSITGLPPRLASNKANSIKTDTPAKVTAEVTTSKMETPGEDRTHVFRLRVDAALLAALENDRSLAERRCISAQIAVLLTFYHGQITSRLTEQLTKN